MLQLTPDRTNQSRSAEPSHTVPSGEITTAAPAVSGVHNSHREMANPGDASQLARSSGRMAKASWDHRASLMIPVCGTATALGRPVEPEVK